MLTLATRYNKSGTKKLLHWWSYSHIIWLLRYNAQPITIAKKVKYIYIYIYIKKYIILLC